MLAGVELLDRLFYPNSERIQPSAVDGQPSSVSESPPDDLSESSLDYLSESPPDDPSELFDDGGTVLHEHDQHEWPEGPPLDSFSCCRATEPNAPSFAWAFLEKETEFYLFSQKTRNTLQDWGYAFWDAATLEDSGGIKELERLRDTFGLWLYQ